MGFRGEPRWIMLAGLLLWAGATAGGDTPSPIVIQGKFDTATEHVLIPVTIGAHVFWCSPDSGFSALVALDLTKATAAGLTVSPGIPTPDGNPPPPGDRSTTTTAIVGGVMFTNQPIILRRFPEEAPDMDCIIGVALLRRFVVEFDYVTPQLRLIERSAYQPPDGTETLPLLFRTNLNVPYVDIQLTVSDGISLPLRVLPDTGTSYYAAVLVGSAMARARSLLPSAPAVVYADGRITQILAARPRAISAGASTVTEPVIALLEGSLGANGSIADGTLGSGFFRKFTAAFDFDGRKLYLRPNDRLSEKHVFDASGVGFIRRGNRHIVYDVIPNSVGADAGVRAGDALVTIDYRAAGDLTTLQVRSLLSTDGVTRRLTVERGGQTLTFVLPLKARI
jgi:PDZ domain